jgi:hypothetical protein
VSIEGGVDGIEAAEGFVHDDEVGLVQQRAMNWIFCILWRAPRFFGGFGDLHALAPDVGTLAGGGGVEAVQFAEEDELVRPSSS